MKVIIILDQIQAGLGGKERSDTPLGGKKIAMGSADNVEKALKKVGGQIIGTFYCGTDYYQQNKDVVNRKFTKMAEKMGADVIITGPTFDYPEFSRMAIELASHIKQTSKVPVISALAEKNNKELIENNKNDLLIVKMPKKGDAGLAESLEVLAQGCKSLVNKENIDSFKKESCY